MRDLINQIAQSYRSAKVEAQDAVSLLVRAQEPETKRTVWIQIMRGVLGNDPKIAMRFRTLAAAIRQLNHPNISAIREVGEKGGLPYVVVRALEKAQPLAARLDQPWAVDAAADVVMQTGSALEHAYKKGVLHGNLSPNSLWLEEDGQVQVVGLGVRQILELLQMKLQQADSPYVAPERRGGGPADPRADVYALAAILYSLLTRRAPVIIQEKLLPASRFNPDVPGAMDAVIAKGLAQNPAERYPDAHALVAALGAVPLIPAVSAALTAVAHRICPKCGTRNPSGRFCTKCGTALPEEVTAGPAGAAEQPAVSVTGMGSEPAGAQPVHQPQPPVGLGASAPLTPRSISVATGALSAQFPDPLPMPQIDLAGLWAHLAEETRLAMPKPLAMPVIDWAAVAPPMPKIAASGNG